MLLRRMRAIVVNSLIWGIFWGGAEAVTFLLLFGTGIIPPPNDFLGYLPSVAFGGLIFGLECGAAYAVIVSIAERKNNLAQLSRLRMAMWGLLAVVGVTALEATRIWVPGFSVLTQAAVLIGGTIVSGGIGALLSSAQLRIAKGAASGEGEPSLLEDSARYQTLAGIKPNYLDSMF